MENIKIEINYCNEVGDICIATFTFKKSIDNIIFEEFLSKLYDSKYGLVDSHIKGFEINSLILNFKNFDFIKLNCIYNEGKKHNIDNITNIILEYFTNFVEINNRVFCTANESKAIIKTSSLSAFKNQESIVLNKILSSKREAIIDDILEYRNKKLNKIRKRKLEYSY